MKETMLALLRGGETRRYRRAFSRVGWALSALLLLQLGVQWLLAALISALAPQLFGLSWMPWLLAALADYGVAFPAAALIIGTLPRSKPIPGRGMEPQALLSRYIACMGALYLANLLGLAFISALSRNTGAAIDNPVSVLAGQPVILNLILSCLCAPVAEELLFRGVLLDRMRRYGDRFALLASALLFSLVHGNLYQIPYAFAVGMILAHTVLETGQLRWSILLHAAVNAMSAGVVPLLSLLGSTGDLLLSAFILFCIAYGVGYLARNWRVLQSLSPGPAALGGGEKWGLFLVNPGMTVFCAAVLLAVWLSVML